MVWLEQRDRCARGRQSTTQSPGRPARLPSSSSVAGQRWAARGGAAQCLALDQADQVGLPGTARAKASALGAGRAGHEAAKPRLSKLVYSSSTIYSPTAGLEHGSLAPAGAARERSVRALCHSAACCGVDATQHAVTSSTNRKTSVPNRFENFLKYFLDCS